MSGLEPTEVTAADGTSRLAWLVPTGGGPKAPAGLGSDVCCYRSEQVVRIGACNLCGLRGQPFDVLWCALHACECSRTRQHSRVRSCLACQFAGEDRVSTAGGSDYRSGPGTTAKRH